MTNLLAVEGGYQSFHLHGGEWFWLVFSALTALLAIAVGVGLMKDVLAEDEGTPKMKEIALAIEEGALAYLKRQFKTIGIILIPLVVLVFFTATKIGGVHANGSSFTALSFVQSGIFRTLAFLLGCTMSGLTGFIGMSLAVKGNVRTAAAAKRGSLPAALKVAFRTGGVAGMFTVGLGLIGATTIIMIFQNTSSAILIGFGFGGSLLALFLRVGGGIFTKAADVGADLVGKVEAGIPEDDPRNAATIADNVGDNVGDCAGMAADLFESYEVTLVASIILGVAAFKSIGANPALGLIFPVIARALGVLSSIVGVFAVKATDKDKSAMAPINRGFLVAGVLTVVTTFLVAIFYVGNHHGMNEGWKVFGAVTAGLVLAQLLSRLTEYFTSTETRPVRDIAEATRTGPATVVLSGIASGLESSVYAIILIAITIGVAIAFSGGNIEFAFYLVALVGMGMLATTGVVVSEDTFGPVSDNAAGIAEMSGEFEGEPERIMVSLDAVGNTTKAVTKGFAIGSAVIASVALFSSFIETIGGQVKFFNNPQGSELFKLVQINVADPKTFIGLMIGGSIAFMFSSLAIRAVGRTAGTVVQEVRRQFREHPGIMDYTEKPEYGRVIDICTTSALRELATPALLAVLTPVVVGFGLGWEALGAFLAAVIVVGQLMANFLSNSGGAWDNAKKYIEDGHEGGKGSEAHKAAVIGDTVGDPFKDTAGPALNPLIKVMNLVSLLILPAVVTLGRGQMNTTSSGGGYAVAGVALLILIGAIAYSKRKVHSLDYEGPGATPPVGPTVSTAVAASPVGARETVAGSWAAVPPADPTGGYGPYSQAGPAWGPAAGSASAGMAAPGTGPSPWPDAPATPPAGPASAGWPDAPSGPATPPSGTETVPGASWLPPEVRPEGMAPGAGDLSGAPVQPGTPSAGAVAVPPVVPVSPMVDPFASPPFGEPAAGVVPGAPVAPVVPLAPVAPDAPVAPVAPVAPDAPVAPESPTAPDAPVAPESPTAVMPAAAPADVPAPAPAPAPAASAGGAGPVASGGPPAFITPANQAHIDTSQPFRWVAVAGVTEYCVTVGIAKGADDLVNSGPLSPSQTSFQVPSLPAGRQLWARIYASDGSHWSHADVSFSAAPTQAELQWPSNGQAQVSSDRPFTWSRVPWATNYWLTVGTVAGGSDVLNTGPLPASQSSFGSLPAFPAGVALYARLLTNDGSNWTYVDVTFTAAGSAGAGLGGGPSAA